MCSSRKKYATDSRQADSQLFDLYLWPPEQGHDGATIPIDAELMFDVETYDLDGVSCTVFLTRAELMLDLQDYLLVRNSRLGDELKPFVERSDYVQKVTEKLVGSGKVDANASAAISSLQGNLSSALTVSKERVSESEHTIEHQQVLRRVVPTTNSRWIITEPNEALGRKLKGKYLSPPDETGAGGVSLCIVEEDGEEPEVTLNLYCRPMDVKSKLDGSSSFLQKISGSKTNKEAVISAVRAKSLKTGKKDAMIVLASIVLRKIDVD